MKTIDKSNPMYGKTHTREARKKISNARKKYTLDKHPSWKGGKRISHGGYYEIRNKDHHRSRKNGYVFEHILIAEKMLSREIKINEHVHHINKNKLDNRVKNLQVMTHGEHTKEHSKDRRKGVYISCEMCGKQFYSKQSHAKIARFCSARCNGISSNIGKLNDKGITREKLINVLIKNKGDKKESAKFLGVHWSTIYKKIKRYGVDSNEFE